MIKNPDVIIIMVAGISSAICVGMTVWILLSRFQNKKSLGKPVKEKETSGDHRMVDLELKKMKMALQQEKGIKSRFLVICDFIGSNVSLSSAGDDLILSYSRAGWPGGLSNTQITGMPLAIAIIFTLIFIIPAAMVAPPLGLSVPVLGFALGYLGVKCWISGKNHDRLASVSDAMPYVMDLICMSMSSGASYLMVLDMIVTNYENHPIGDEFAIIQNNIQHGISIEKSMEAFKKRLPEIPIAVAFADDVIQSQRYGRPLVSILEDSSQRFKTMRIQIAREKAGKAKVSILAPGILILFGSLLILFGPFIVNFVYQQSDSIGNSANTPFK